MSERFVIRSKCLSWPNVREQVGIKESNGLSLNDSPGRLPGDFIEFDEGRINDDSYRRSNEQGGYVGSELRGRLEVCWDNTFNRATEHSQLYGSADEYIGNDLYRNYIFDDWNVTKHLRPEEFNDGSYDLN